MTTSHSDFVRTRAVCRRLPAAQASVGASVDMASVRWYTHVVALVGCILCVALPACLRCGQSHSVARGGPDSSNRGNSAAGAPSVQRLFEERAEERNQLVRRSIEPLGLDDSRVLAAMRRVPRHAFVPETMSGDAYENRPLPIGWGQTISQPAIVAMMTAAARVKPSDRCLEIGTGSGYQAAILAELCSRVYSIEYLPNLAAFARRNLESLGYRVELRQGDGYQGWPDAAPFDVIIVTAAPDAIPPPLLRQLAIGGRLVIPVGGVDSIQALQSWTRRREGQRTDAFEREELGAVRFVPFLGPKARSGDSSSKPSE